MVYSDRQHHMSTARQVQPAKHGGVRPMSFVRWHLSHISFGKLVHTFDWLLASRRERQSTQRQEHVDSNNLTCVDYIQRPTVVSMPRTRSKASMQAHRCDDDTTIHVRLDHGESMIVDPSEDAAAATAQIEAIVGNLAETLKRQVEKQRAELQAENERIKRMLEELNQEKERLRQELEREKEIRTRERDVWTRETDKWKIQARQLRAELIEKGGDIEGLQRDIDELHTRFDDETESRRAALEAIVADTVGFWQSARAAQEMMTQRTQRVLLVQLDQIMREEPQPRPIEEILEGIMHEDNGIHT